MVRTIRCIFCGLMVTAVGCVTTEKLGFNAAKIGHSNNQPTSTLKAGSPDFSTSDKLKDPAKTRLAYAVCHEQSGNLQEARNTYLKILEKNPKDIEALLGLARIDRAYGRDSDADARLQKALKLHPKDPRVFLALGKVHESKGEFNEALQKMRAAHDLAPYNTLYEFHLAVVETQLGDLDRALEHFTRSTGKAEAHFNIGYILNGQGNKSEAEKHLKQALKLKPDLKQAETELAKLLAPEDQDIQQAWFEKKK